MSARQVSAPQLCGLHQGVMVEYLCSLIGHLDEALYSFGEQLAFSLPVAGGVITCSTCVWEHAVGAYCDL